MGEEEAEKTTEIRLEEEKASKEIEAVPETENLQTAAVGPRPETGTENAPPEAPGDEPSVEEAPAAEPSVEEAPTTEPTVEEAPTTEPTVEEAPTAEPSVEDAPAAEPSIEETPTAEPTVEETPAAEPTVEEAPAAEPSVEETPTAEPSVEETPTAETSVEEAPTAEPTVEEAPETPAPEALPEPAEQRTDIGKFDRTAKDISAIRAALAAAAKGDRMKNIAKELITKTKLLFTKVKGYGLELKEEKELFKQAITAIKAEEYIKGSQLTKMLKVRLEEEERNYFLASVSTSLEEVRGRLAQAGAMGVEISSFEESLDRAQATLDNKEFRKLEDFASEIKEFNSQTITNLNGLIEEKLTEIIPNELVSIQEVFEKARSLEIEIQVEVDECSKVEELGKENRNIDAYNILMDARGAVTAKINERMKEISTAKIEEAKETLKSLETEIGRELPELRAQLEKAENAFSDEQYDLVGTMIQDFIVSGEGAKNSFLFEKYSLMANELESDITLIKELGMDISSGEELLGRINENIVSNDYELVEELAPQLKEIVDNAKTVEARKLASSLLGTTRQLYNTLNAAKVEMGEAKISFKEGILSIKAQNFVKGCKEIQAAKGELEVINQKYLLKVLSSGIEEAFRYYGQFEKIDYFAETFKEEVKKVLEEAKAFLDQEQLEEAQEKIKMYEELKEEIRNRTEKFEEARALSEKMNALRISADELSVDIANEEALITEGGERMADYMLEEAVSTYQEAEKRINESIQAKLLENAQAKLEEAAGFFESFRKFHSDPEKIETLIGTARDLIEQKEYKRSIETSDHVISLVGASEQDKIMNEVKGIFNQFLTVIEECEELGVDTLRPQALQFKAKTEFERGNYEVARGIAQETLEMTLNSQKEFLRERAQESIAEMLEMLKEASSLGIDYSSIMELTTRSRKLFDSGEFIEAKDVSEKAIQPLKELLGGRLKEMIKEEIAGLSEIMGRARELEVDISAEKETLASISVLKKEGKYYDAIEILRNTKENISSKITGDFRERAAHKKENAADRLVTLEEKGCNVEEAKKILEEAAALIDAGKYQESLSIVDNAMTITDGLWEEFQQITCQELIEEAEALSREVTEVTAGNVDLAVPSELINAAIERLKEKDFEFVKTQIQEAQSQIDRLYYHYVIDTLLATHDLLLEVKNLGANVSAAQQMFTQAKVSLEKKEYPKAIEFSGTALANTKEARITYMKDEVMKNLKVATTIASKLKEKDVPIEELEKLIENVSNKMKDEDIPGAFETSKEVRSVAAGFRDGFKRSMIVMATEECNLLMEKLSDFGVDTSDIAVKLQPVDTLLEKMKFPEALKITKDSNAILLERYNSHYHDLLSEKIRETREHLDEISDKIDVSKPRLTLKEAEESLKENDFGKCEELTQKAKKIAEKSKHSSLVIEAANVLAYAGDTIREGIKEGQDVSDMNALLMEASEAFENREYENVLEICATIGARVDRFKEDKLSNIAKEAVRKAKTIIEAAKSIKADVKKPSLKYKTAMEAYKAGKFQSSLDLAQEIQTMATYEKDFRATTAVVDSVKLKLEEIGKNGDDITEAREILKAVDDALNGKDFDAARNIAKESIKNAMDIYMLNTVSDSIERSQEYVSFALDNEIFVNNYFQEPLVPEMVVEEGKCPKCGQEVPEKAMFCLWCGFSLK